jgi:periplasmic protein TonB
MRAMAEKLEDFRIYVRQADLFTKCLLCSALLHISLYAFYFISNLPGKNGAISSETIKIENMDVDFEDIPPELIGGENSPAPVEKNEWIEGTGNKSRPDAAEEDFDINALSGDGTDPDGYLYAIRGDRPPTPIIDFDLKKYFPRAARQAGITNATVVVLIQVDERGRLDSARVISKDQGYGFNDAAMNIVQRARFAPGYKNSKPVRMTHKLPIAFVLVD